MDEEELDLEELYELYENSRIRVKALRDEIWEMNDCVREATIDNKLKRAMSFEKALSGIRYRYVAAAGIMNKTVIRILALKTGIEL